MSRVLQTLTIDLTANTANFSAAMTKAQQISLSSTRNIAKSFALVGAAAAAMGAAVAGAVAGIVVKADEYVTQIQRMAEKTGQSTEEISKLAYASALSGGNLDDLGTLMVRFNRNAAESAQGNKLAQNAFKDLGVSVTASTGRFKPAGLLLEQTIAALNRMPESVQKTNVEVTLFGRAGAELAPVLKILGTNAAQTAADMKNFGLTISGPQAAAAEHLAQTYDRGQEALTGMSNTILQAATPALQAMLDKVLALANNGKLVAFAKVIGDDIAKAATLAGNAVAFLGAHANQLKTALEGFAAAEAISFLLGINTAALRSSSGLAKLALGFGTFAGKASGLGPLVKAVGSVGGSAVRTSGELIGMARAFGVAETATYACQTAWEAFTASLVANPAVIALAGLAAGFGILYAAMESNVREGEKLGGVAVTWSDQWQAAIDNTKDRLAGLKRILQDLLPGSTGSILQDVKAFNALPSFGQRAEQVAQQRVKDQAKPVPKVDTPAVSQPKPDAQVAKPDPYKEELAKLNTELRNSQLALNAAMQNSVDAQRAATEAGKAGLIVTELQSKLKRDLTAAEREAITSRVRDTGENQNNAAAVSSIRERTDATKDSLATEIALTGVIGQGVAAQDAAKQAVESATLARNLGAEAASKYGDRLADLRRVQTQAAAAARSRQSAEEAYNTRQEAADTDALAAATLRGTSAVEAETLQIKLNAIAREHSGDPSSVRELQVATEQLTAAEQKLRAVQQGQAYTSPLARYQKTLEDVQRTTTEAAQAGVQVDATQVWMANREAALHYQQELERIHDVTGSLNDGVRDFFTDMVNNAQSAATQVRSVLGSAFESLNDTLAKLLTGQKASFASFFRSIGEQISKIGLQRAETAIVGVVTGRKSGASAGKQSDPALGRTNSLLSTSNAILKAIESAVSSGGKPAAGVAAVPQATVDSAAQQAASQTGGLVSGALSAALSAIPGGGIIAGLASSLFGGHRALGGNVQAGMTYDVGEMGRERFTPSTSGTITPNSKLGGGSATYVIQNGSGVTPEQMHMYVQSTLTQYHPHVVRASVAAMQDHQRRRPSSAH